MIDCRKFFNQFILAPRKVVLAPVGRFTILKPIFVEATYIMKEPWPFAINIASNISMLKIFSNFADSLNN